MFKKFTKREKKKKKQTAFGITIICTLIYYLYILFYLYAIFTLYLGNAQNQMERKRIFKFTLRNVLPLKLYIIHVFGVTCKYFSLKHIVFTP